VELLERLGDGNGDLPGVGIGPRNAGQRQQEQRTTKKKRRQKFRHVARQVAISVQVLNR
jgi:hypothetical protein